MAFDLSTLTEEEAKLMVVAYKGEGTVGMTLATYINGEEMLYTFKPCEEQGCLCAVMPSIAVPESPSFEIIKPFVKEECNSCEEEVEETGCGSCCK